MWMRGSRARRVWTALMNCMGGNARSDSSAPMEGTHYERGEGS